MKRRPAQAKNKKISFPVVVERGPTGLKGTATIHRTPTTVDGKTYESFTVVYYHAGSRHRLRFNEYAKAYSKAEQFATELSNGREDALFLSGDERRIYEAAAEGLREIGDPALDSVVREYVAAKQKLGSATLIEAVTFFINHGGGTVKKGSLQDIRKNMLETLESDKRSDYHVRDVARHTKRFTEFFSQPIAEITTGQINEWLGALCEHLSISRQAVTKHLLLLESAKLVTTEWRGREKLHHLNPRPIKEISRHWIGKYS